MRSLLHARFSDAQCGFKTITREAADEFLPLVESTNWFFDTELLVLAERVGHKIFELPVRWVENPASHVKIFPTIVEDIHGIVRLERRMHRMVASRLREVAVR